MSFLKTNMQRHFAVLLVVLVVAGVAYKAYERLQTMPPRLGVMQGIGKLPETAGGDQVRHALASVGFREVTDIIGYVDEAVIAAGVLTAHGWAVRLSNPLQPVQVSVVFGGNVIGVVNRDEMRPDVAKDRSLGGEAGKVGWTVSGAATCKAGGSLVGVAVDTAEKQYAVLSFGGAVAGCP